MSLPAFLSVHCCTRLLLWTPACCTNIVLVTCGLRNVHARKLYIHVYLKISNCIIRMRRLLCPLPALCVATCTTQPPSDSSGPTARHPAAWKVGHGAGFGFCFGVSVGGGVLACLSDKMGHGRGCVDDVGVGVVVGECRSCEPAPFGHSCYHHDQSHHIVSRTLHTLHLHAYTHNRVC